ncbi:MAG: hypothetical protein AAFN10_16005 [Bacteroidota bacterium]
MKHALLILGAFYGFFSPLWGQALEVFNPLISTDSVRFAPNNYKDGYWRVSFWVQNQSEADIKVESAIEKEFPHRKLIASTNIPITVGEIRKLSVWVPIDYESEGQEREITLRDDNEAEIASFRLITETARPTFSKRPSGWTSIREDQIYPLRVTFGNTIEQSMILDSLVWDSAATDSSLRFKRWELSTKLPEKIVPGGKAEIKIRIWTKGLFATIAGEFSLHYHLADGTPGVLPFAHAFGVEPNIWVEEGGQWEVGSIPYGKKIKRNFWLTHEGAECITLIPEYDSFISLQDTVVCPGDTTYGVVQYPTICDSVGELDIEVALFVKEFSGHVPFRFRGEMLGKQTPPGQWLMVTDSVHDLGILKLKDRRASHSIEIYNQAPVALTIESVGFSGYHEQYGFMDYSLKVDLSASTIPAGESIRANLGINLQYMDIEEVNWYFNLLATTEGCPAFSTKNSVRIRADIRP